MPFFVRMIMVAAISTFMLMIVLVVMVMPAGFFVFMVVIVIVPMIVSAASLAVRRPGVDVEFHSLDVLPLGAVEVHVQVAEFQLADFPLQRAGFDAEVNESAHGHVAADSGNAIEIECFHGD